MPEVPDLPKKDKREKRRSDHSRDWDQIQNLPGKNYTI